MATRIIAIIYSRLSSNRLPNKALLSLGNSSIIDNVITSTKELNVDELVLATSTDKSDDLLVELAESTLGIKTFRGSLDNVAMRTVECLKEYNADYFIRINGDSPIIPVETINMYLNRIKSSEYTDFDLISNIIERTFPYGCSIEIFNAKTFINNFKYFNKEEQEHVTKYFYKHLHKFKYVSIKSEVNNSKTVLTIDDNVTYIKMYKLFKNENIKTLTIQQIIKTIND